MQMMETAIKKELLSARYENDGRALVLLNDVQKRYVEKFIRDERISTIAIPECLLCGHREFTQIAEKDRYGIPLKTVVCNQCGLIFSLNQLTPESTRLFYSEYYRRIYEGVENPSLDYYEKSYRASAGGTLPQFLKPGSVVVEIGAGGGWNLLKYKNHHMAHYGFDYDENLIRFGKDKFGLNLFVGGVTEARASGAKADYLYLSQVFEHVTHPVEFLSETKHVMKNDAVLKMSVPCANTLLFCGDSTGYDLLGTLQNAHNFLFDEFTLKYVALKAGYRVSICFGGHIVLQKQQDTDTLRNMEKSFRVSPRGAPVIRFLKFCEKLVPLKRRMIPSKIETKMHYFYYALKPLDFLKFYFMFRKGVVFS